MASEIIDSTPSEHIYQVARNWVITALQYCRDMGYWEQRAREAEKKLEENGKH